MSKKQIAIILSILASLVFCWILPVMGFLPSGNEYIYNRIIIGIYGTAIALGITALMLKYDNKSFSEVGLKWEKGTLFRFLKGFLIGVVIAGTMIGILVFTTDYNIIYNREVNISKALIGLIAFLPLAFMEEIIYRGYPFTKLNKLIGLRPSLIIMAILFAYYHDTTGATLHWQLLGPGVWGIVYGIYTVTSKGISMPTGIHMAANVVLAVLGTKDSVYAIWTLDLVAPNMDAAESHANTVGILLQLAFLIFGIILVERYIRKKY